MNVWRYAIAVAVLASFAAGAAVVYKWTDADGVVHFSDQPVPGAEKIVTSGGASNGISAGPAAGPVMMSRPRNGPGQAVASLVIESPAKEQVFFNEDVVTVRAHVEPGLQPTQTITWSLNGRPLAGQAPAGLSFALPALARGTYTLGAIVTDTATGGSQTADSVTFYVKQPSELAPQHKKS